MARLSYEEGQEAQKRFPVVVADIAGCLGHAWHFEMTHECSAKVIRNDGLAVRLWFDMYENRIEATPAVPRCDGTARSLRDYGVIKYGEKAPAATCAATRAADKVAGDIQRKVVEPYAQLFPRVMEMKNRTEETRRAAQRTAGHLAEILEDHKHHERHRVGDTFNVYPANDLPGSSEWRVDPGDSVDVHFRRLSPAQARSLADWLSKECPRDQREVAR